jgi:hypothetical protein
VKKVPIERATLGGCINVGLEGMDEEQVALGSSDKFWKLISKRRKEKKVSRAELEKSIKSKARKT